MPISTATVLYEFPLNERMRNFMRLENSFTQIHHFANGKSAWDSQVCLFGVINILSIIERSDFRSELLKELDRNIIILSNLLDLPTVDTNRLTNILDELHTQQHALQNLNGKLGDILRSNNLINSVRQRLSITNGTNSFEISSFYYWLNQDASYRQAEISKWLTSLSVLEDGVLLLNRLMRESAVFESQTAINGFYQKPLNAQQSFQLIRVLLPADCSFFPEISGSKHRVSVRFLHNQSDQARPTQLEGEVEFELSCCSI